jgi:hypothetical protein
MTMKVFPVILSAAVLAGPSWAQTPAAHPLGKLHGSATETFSAISGFAELPNGQVVVSDARERKLLLVDFDKGTASPISRTGSGPTEFASPGAILRFAADSVAVVDGGQQRLLVLDGGGKPVRSFPMQVATSGFSIPLAPRYADAQGRLYLQGFSARGNPNAAFDSVPLLRIDRAGTRMDTVAYLKTPVIRMRQTSATTFSRQLPDPFTHRDDWAVTADGRLAIVAAEDYHVDWITPSGRTTGAPLPFAKIAVTAEDRAEVAARAAPSGVSGFGTEQRPAPSATAAQASDAGNTVTTKPPFLMRNILPAPTGMLWIGRTRAWNDAIPTYDVIDRFGRVVDRVSLPKRSRVIGFGATSIYLAREDEDGLLHLERWTAR